VPHNAVAFGVLLVGSLVVEERRQANRLGERHDRPRNAGASLTPQLAINSNGQPHPTAYAALRLLLAIIFPTILLAPTVSCRLNTNLQRTSSTRRTACDVRPQKTSHGTRFVLLL
jgi:hypothetical protein